MYERGHYLWSFFSKVKKYQRTGLDFNDWKGIVDILGTFQMLFCGPRVAGGVVEFCDSRSAFELSGAICLWLAGIPSLLFFRLL